jgi:hypothetical protein
LSGDGDTKNRLFLRYMARRIGRAVVARRQDNASANPLYHANRLKGLGFLFWHAMCNALFQDYGNPKERA